MSYYVNNLNLQDPTVNFDKIYIAAVHLDYISRLIVAYSSLLWANGFAKHSNPAEMWLQNGNRAWGQFSLSEERGAIKQRCPWFQIQDTLQPPSQDINTLFCVCGFFWCAVGWVGVGGIHLPRCWSLERWAYPWGVLEREGLKGLRPTTNQQR